MNISYFPNLHYWLPLLENLGTVKLSCLKHCQTFCWQFLVEISCLRQIQHLINLSFFMIVVAVYFSVFYSAFVTNCCNCFAVFIRTKHFCKSSKTCGSSPALCKHLACNLWEKTPFKWHLQFTLFETLIWKYLSTRLVSSEKYQPSFLS